MIASTISIVHKDVDHPNRIVLADPVFQAFRKQRALTAIRALNEASHPIPPQIARESYRENQIRRRVFTQPGSVADILAAGNHYRRRHKRLLGYRLVPTLEPTAWATRAWIPVGGQHLAGLQTRASRASYA